MTTTGGSTRRPRFSMRTRHGTWAAPSHPLRQRSRRHEQAQRTVHREPGGPHRNQGHGRDDDQLDVAPPDPEHAEHHGDGQDSQPGAGELHSSSLRRLGTSTVSRTSARTWSTSTPRMIASAVSDMRCAITGTHETP